jgi:lysophospholipase
MLVSYWAPILLWSTSYVLICLPVDGAGVVSALDARNSTSVQSGTGGLFQISSYLTGLSGTIMAYEEGSLTHTIHPAGGSWFVSSLVFNDLPTIPDLVFGNQTLSGWQLYIDLLRPDPNNETSFDTISYYGALPAIILRHPLKSAA